MTITPLFLTLHPEVSIVYCGEALDPAHAQIHSAEYVLDQVEGYDGEPPRLRVIEWPNDPGRLLALCDRGGVLLSTAPVKRINCHENPAHHFGRAEGAQPDRHFPAPRWPAVGPTYLLTVPGRKSGLPRTNPVAPGILDGTIYILQAYTDPVSAIRAPLRGSRGDHR